MTNHYADCEEFAEKYFNSSECHEEDKNVDSEKIIKSKKILRQMDYDRLREVDKDLRTYQEDAFVRNFYNKPEMSLRNFKDLWDVVFAKLSNNGKSPVNDVRYVNKEFRSQIASLQWDYKKNEDVAHSDKSENEGLHKAIVHLYSLLDYDQRVKLISTLVQTINEN